MNKLLLKRAYEDATSDDGYRILVDRLWPRGQKKEKLAIDLWAKDITPSTEIRKYFDHQADKYEEFTKLYLYELEHNSYGDEFIDIVNKELDQHNVSLIYGAKDPTINHAQILKSWLELGLAKRG